MPMVMADHITQGVSTPEEELIIPSRIENEINESNEYPPNI